MNRHIATVIVAPMNSARRQYPTRVNCRFREKDGQIVLDQIRTVDKAWLVKKLGQISNDESLQILAVLQEMFAE
jgi:mRNA interferase MazF